VGVSCCKCSKREKRQGEKLVLTVSFIAIIACDIMINMTNLDHGKKELKRAGNISERKKE
jgi:hypothetical protein